jgi:hypothetical protein
MGMKSTLFCITLLVTTISCSSRPELSAVVSCHDSCSKQLNNCVSKYGTDPGCMKIDSDCMMACTVVSK